MKIKVIYFLICLGCTLALKNNICVYASILNTSTTTNDSISIENDYLESDDIKKVSNNVVRISNSDEFIDNLSNGNNIILDSNIDLDLHKTFTTDSAISIDTNGYGIKIGSGNIITFDGPFEFYGGSNSNPMFIIEPNSLLSLKNSSLTVDNDNAVGVYINKNAHFSLNNGSISVDGDNSVGIYSDTKIDDKNVYINYSTLDVNGSNSIGIECTKDVTLLYDILTCSGENSVIIDAPKVILDSCSTDTILNNAAIIDRYVSNICIPSYQAALNGDKISFLNYVTFILKDKEKSAPDQDITLNVTWDDTADYNTIGEYKILGKIINPYCKVPINELIDEFPDTIETTLYIKDPNVLDISYIINIDTFNNLNTITIEFLKAPLDSEENMLYYSTDGGKEWSNYPNDLYFLNDNQLSILDIEFNKDYLFQYILSDGTKSNFLKININSDGIYISSDVGGDRDSGDLGSNELPLPIEKSNTNDRTTSDKDLIHEDNDSENNDSENSSNVDIVNTKSSSRMKKHTDSNESSSYSDSSNIYTIDDNSNVIIMDTTKENSTFVNGALEDKTHVVEKKVLLSDSNDLNNSSTFSNSGQSNDNYKEDSVHDVQTNKKEENHNAVKELHVDTESKGINADINTSLINETQENLNETKQKLNDKSSISENEQNSKDKLSKNFKLFIGILASLTCVISLLFIKKGKK